MTKIRQALTCVLLLTLIVVAVYAAGFALAATVAIASVPNEIKATRLALTEQVAALRIDAMTEIEMQANALSGELHGDVRLADAQVSAISGRLDKRVGDALVRVDVALAAVTGVRKDLQPVLASIPPAVASAGTAAQNAAALAKDAQDSLDDSYDDWRGLLDSAGVATTQTAQTMQTINAAAPAMAASAQKNADSVAGITADAHTMTTAMLKPKSVFGKIWAAITVASRFAGLL
jgi:hypothetical protein